MKIPSEHGAMLYRAVSMVYHGLPWHKKPWYAVVYHGIPWCVQRKPCYTTVYRGKPWYDRDVLRHGRTMFYHGVPWYTTVYMVKHGTTMS